MNDVDTSPKKPLIVEWLNGIRAAHIAHQRAAARYAARHRWIGIPATVLSIAVGTSVFGSLASTEQRWILVIAGTMSVVAAISTGLQSFLDYAALAAKHQAASVKYAYLKRDVESLIDLEGEKPNKDEIQRIKEEWNSADAESPIPPQTITDAARSYVAELQGKRDSADEPA
ncbi:hypothetical protein BH09MYX1_BH09MYX1_67820 [soil metagenome]